MTPPSTSDPWISVTEASKMLCVSRRRVRQFGDQKRLRYETNAEGDRRYVRADVVRLAALRAASDDPRVRRAGGSATGQLIAEVFECFDNGLTLAQIVQQTRQPPELIRRLHLEYSTPLGETPPAPATLRSAKKKQGLAEPDLPPFPRYDHVRG